MAAYLMLRARTIKDFFQKRAGLKKTGVFQADSWSLPLPALEGPVVSQVNKILRIKDKNVQILEDNSDEIAIIHQLGPLDGEPFLPIVSDYLVFIGTNRGSLYCFDYVSGVQLWKVALNRPFHSQQVVNGNRIYQLDENGDLHAFDKGRDHHIWTYPLKKIWWKNNSFPAEEVYIRGHRVPLEKL